MDAAKIVSNENDILLGRGGKNNQHSGNERLRLIAYERCEEYRRSTKKGKAIVAMDMVYQIRNMQPEGRFLKRDVMGNWVDVGDHAAKEKVGQVLRDALIARFGRTGWTPGSSSASKSSKKTPAKKLDDDDFPTKRPTKPRASKSAMKMKPAPTTPDTSDESVGDESPVLGMVPVSKSSYRTWSVPKSEHITNSPRASNLDPFAAATQEMASSAIQYSSSPLRQNFRRQFFTSPLRGTKRRFEPIPTPPRINYPMYSPTGLGGRSWSRSNMSQTNLGMSDHMGGEHLSTVFDFENDPIVEGSYK